MFGILNSIKKVKYRSANRLCCAFICFIAGPLVISGCATYSQNFKVVEKELAAQQPQKALKALEKQYSDSGADAVLYYLNKGMLLRMDKHYAESNAAFEKAQKLIDELDAVSVSEQASSLTINDTFKSYIGEDFEQVLLHLYKAFNYLDLGQPYEARVEVLQVGERLQRLTQSSNTAVYRQDAFAQYISGIIYEELGEWSDALISYRKAYEAYEKYRVTFGVAVPKSLKFALLRLTERQGLTDELNTYRKKFGIDTWPTVNDLLAKGQLIFILNNGLVSMKQEKSVNTVDPKSGRLIRIALPAYRPRLENVTGVRVRIEKDKEIYAEVVENINAIAIKTLQAELPVITARAIARAVLKYQASRKAEKKDQALGVLMNVAGLVTERAATRSWSTLPYDIFMARVPLEPGKYDMVVELLDRTGKVASTNNYPSIDIEKGKYTYINSYWVSR